MTPPDPTRQQHLRIPFRLQVVFGSRKFFTVFCIVMAAFFLHGPIPARIADHNGYCYLLGPFVCPLVGLAIYLLFPFNPYRANGRSERSLYRLDERDEDARRLVELLRSPGCRRAAILAAVKVAALLFLIMAGFTIVFRASLNWELPSSWFYRGLGGGALFAWLLIRLQATAWALMTWWEVSGEPRKP